MTDIRARIPIPPHGIMSLREQPLHALLDQLESIVDELCSAIDELSFVQRTIIEKTTYYYRRAVEGSSHSAREHYVKEQTLDLQRDVIELEGKVRVLTERKWLLIKLIDSANHAG